MTAFISSEEDSSTAIPGKIYDYLGCAKFILSLADQDSAVARFVKREKLGIVVDLHDVASIKKAFKKLLEMHQEGMLVQYLTPQLKQRYSRIHQTKQLSELFNQIIQSKPPSPATELTCFHDRETGAATSLTSLANS